MDAWACREGTPEDEADGRSANGRGGEEEPIELADAGKLGSSSGGGVTDV